MKAFYFLLTILFLSFAVKAQNTSESLLQIADRYWMSQDVVYATANNTPLKLDVWYPRDNPKPTPTLVSIHGDKDDVVPYSHAARLHAELDKFKIPNELITIKNGGHGMFQLNEYKTSFDEIWKFLKENKITN